MLVYIPITYPASCLLIWFPSNQTRILWRSLSSFLHRGLCEVTCLYSTNQSSPVPGDQIMSNQMANYCPRGGHVGSVVYGSGVFIGLFHIWSSCITWASNCVSCLDIDSIYWIRCLSCDIHLFASSRTTVNIPPPNPLPPLPPVNNIISWNWPQ